METNDKPVISVRNLDLFYGHFHALKSVTLDFRTRMITGLIGPSGCGKSTLLRALNRMNDRIPGVRTAGVIEIAGRNILDDTTDVCDLRKKVGMVFQRPNPFPLSVRENVVFGLRVEGVSKKEILDEKVESCLKHAWLWDNLKDKLDRSALDLPLDQQQRLCVARLLAVEPEIILLDEPCSALDPISTARIEELLLELKKEYAIIIVTHNMQQAARVSDLCGYMLLGEMIEYDRTANVFTNPGDKRTQDYISGRYG